MKYFWITALLLLALQPAAMAVDVGLYSKNMQKAVTDYNTVYFDNGLLGLQAAIPKCYSKAREIKDSEYNEYCIMLDMLTYFNNKQLNDIGIDFSTPFLSYEQTDSRARAILKASGITTRLDQDKYLKTIGDAAKDIISDDRSL